MCSQTTTETHPNTKNPLRSIRKWDSYMKILDSRMMSSKLNFNELTGIEQSNYLTEQLCKAGRSVIPSTSTTRRKKQKQSKKMSQLLQASKKTRKLLKTHKNKTDQEFSHLKERAKRETESIRAQFYKEAFNTKRRMRELLNTKGTKAQKLFWQLTNPKPKKSSAIEALESDGKITTTPAEMNVIVEKFLETKFLTSYDKEEIAWENPDLSKLGEPDVIMSEETAENIMNPITMEELSVNINDLDTSKAEGMDNVTNAMLKNTGPAAREKLLEMYNNIMISGQTPDSWKEGDIALILKKPPNTNINNYRPITLISCVSKLWTKIMAKRISKSIEVEDIIGPEQNGFRPNRSCSDNTFILNTLLELNKSRKKLSYLLFVDLKEAYDRVDRNILFAKLKQLNFPERFITLLTSYYFQDNVSTSSTGARSKTQYQQRGLRQGCNLSSVLFIIYVSELARRIRSSGHGVRLDSGEIIGILLFADDIILIADNTASINALRAILEGWCSDFKMSVSIGKTNIITPDQNFICSVSSDGNSESDIIDQVESYKYLGVMQYAETKRTTKHKGEEMLKRAKMYKNVILSTGNFLPDKVKSLSTIWRSIALPGLLYAADVIPVSDDIIHGLETIQQQVGKSILGIPQSSANPIVNLEMGWKPIQLLLEESVVRFYQRAHDPEFKGSHLVQSCMEWNKTHGETMYIQYLNKLINRHNLSLDTLKLLKHSTLLEYHKKGILQRVQQLPSLNILPIPRTWWTMQPHIEESKWSRTIVKFRCMNTGLGNRDSYRALDAMSQDDGRVTYCPLCLQGRNDEIHLILHCSILSQTRNSIKMQSGSSLSSTLIKLRAKFACTSDQEVVRLFLGQEPRLTRVTMIDRGLALDLLLTSFYREWSKMRGRAIQSPDAWRPH